MFGVQIGLGVTLIVLALVLVVLVLLQSGKDQKLSGTITGGADTYYGQNKGRSRDKILARLTVFVALVFVGIMMAAYILYARYL